MRQFISSCLNAAIENKKTTAVTFAALGAAIYYLYQLHIQKCAAQKTPEAPVASSLPAMPLSPEEGEGFVMVCGDDYVADALDTKKSSKPLSPTTNPHGFENAPPPPSLYASTLNFKRVDDSQQFFLVTTPEQENNNQTNSSAF